MEELVRGTTLTFPANGKTIFLMVDLFHYVVDWAIDTWGRWESSVWLVAGVVGVVFAIFIFGWVGILAGAGVLAALGLFDR